MSEALQLAISKAAKLPESVQEALGRDLLERIAGFDQLKADIDRGIHELDAGQGIVIDVEELIAQLRNVPDDNK